MSQANDRFTIHSIRRGKEWIDRASRRVDEVEQAKISPNAPQGEQPGTSQTSTRLT